MTYNLERMNYLFYMKRIANFIGRSKLSTTVLSYYYYCYYYHSFCSFEWTMMELSKRIIIGQTASFYTLYQFLISTTRYI
jgi:hypothetical protein